MTVIRLSELIKLAVLKAEGEENDKAKREENRKKAIDRKVYLLSEIIKNNINLN